jgi:thiosulfate/3-mercaptopyruvate sulfurtransferase
MNNMIKEISTNEVFQLLGKPETKIIDIRPIDAYNGWCLQNESRCGHIKGAKSLPAKWIEYIDWIEIIRAKKILTQHKIVVYGYYYAESEKVAKAFLHAGYSDISIYNQFITEWSSNLGLPMQFLERFPQLVYPHWIQTLISGGTPPHYNNSKFVICHAHYRNRDAYLSGHIPGAIDMDTLALESPETWNRRSPEELKEALEKHSITSDTTVILYGKFLFPNNADPFPGSAAGHIGAIRCAFIMMYAGVKDVRVLNGGFQSWHDAGYEINTEDVSKKIASDFGIPIPANPGLAVDLPEAKELLRSDDGDLVCVRSWSEYIGEVSGYNYIERKGRIPGAIFSDCGSDAYHMENYCNLDHTTREYHEIEENLIKSGLSREKHNAFYCGTGWRGSEAFYNAWLMGWPRVSVYDGGWFEWSSDPNNPIETGIPVSYLVTQ